MLSSSYRLRKKEVERVYKKGNFFRQDFLNVRFLENHTNHYRFAIVIPKTVAKLATARNRLKRKTSVLVETILPKFQNHLDCMLIFKKAPEEKDIKPTLENIFKNPRFQ